MNTADSFAHPDSRRRFRVIDDQRELRQALEFPLEKWIIFLHPSQDSVVERRYNGPARVSGGAGTGKTVVALHRAAHLITSNPKSRVLLTTFSKTLASRLGQHADLLMRTDPASREALRIDHLHRVAREVWTERTGRDFTPAAAQEVRDLIRDHAPVGVDGCLNESFLLAEWKAVVDDYGLSTWEEYRDFSRVGRGTPLGARQRRQIWRIFEQVLTALQERGTLTWNQLCRRAARLLEGAPARPFDHVVVDESQDFGPAELRLARALVAPGANDLFFCGDEGQRIYKGHYSWASLGIDIRGRSTRLRLNYRTTEQIRRFADGLLPGTLPGPDGEDEARDSVSLLNGPAPSVVACESPDDEIDCLSDWLEDLLREGFCPSDIAVFGRTKRFLTERAEPALARCDAKGEYLTDGSGLEVDRIALGTMHRAKGLEFKAIAVVACEAGRLPPDWLLQQIDDPADRAIFLENERRLLYVACTRARERLLITHSGEASPFLREF